MGRMAKQRDFEFDPALWTELDDGTLVFELDKTPDAYTWVWEAKCDMIEEVCQRCISFYNQRCEHGLLLVTREGNDCPYYRERKPDNTEQGGNKC